MSAADTPFATTGDPRPAELRVGSVLRVPVVAADPASGDDGEIVYDSVLDKFRTRVNGAWTDMGGGGGGGGVTAESLFYDAVAIGDALGGGWTEIGGPFTFGALYQALHPVKFTGVKFHATASGAAPSTWTVTAWVGGVVVASGTLLVSTVGSYSVLFGTTNGVGALTPYTAAVGDFVTISAECQSSISVSAEGSGISGIVGPSVRLIYSALYGVGAGVRPSTGGNGVYGIAPILAAP